MTDTYTFTSKDWKATLNGNQADWTSGKAGGGYSNNGVQVTTTYTGANATSLKAFTDIKKITVTYNTNKSAGAGSVDIKIGENDAASNDVAYSGSGDGRSANYTTDFNYDTPQTDAVTITVNTTTNSIYLCSIAITYDDGTSSGDTRAATTITLKEGYSTEVYMGEAATAAELDKVSTESADIDGATVTWSSSKEEVAKFETDGSLTIVGPGTTTITASYDGDETNYKPCQKDYTLNVYGSYTSLADLQKAVTSTSTPVKITFNDAIVTGTTANNAYIAEGDKGALIYTADHGLTVGQKLNGTIKAKFVLYRGATEITNFTTEGLDIADGTATATEKKIGDITAENQSALVTLKEVTYSDGKLTDGENEITYYDTFKPTPSLSDMEDGKTYTITGVIVLYNSTIEISPRTADDVVKVVSKQNAVSAWKSEGAEVSSICVVKGETINVSFDTNSTGEKSFESSNPEVAAVASDGTITLGGSIGQAIITATTAANDDFFLSTSSLSIMVGQPVEDGIFNFAIFQDYGSGMAPTSSNVYETEEKTWTAGNVTMKTGGKVRWFVSTSNEYSLRLYNNGDNYSYMKIAVPDGYVITGIDGLPTTGNLKADKGTKSSSKWYGKAQEITFTYESTSSSANFTDVLTITYTTNATIDVTTTGEYTAFCSPYQLDFTGTDITVYKAKLNGNYVELTAISENIAPAGAGVILKGEAKTVSVAIAETSPSNISNQLVGITADTEVAYAAGEKFNYILQGGVFKKATGAKLKAGKAYLSTTFDVTAAAANELQIVIEGETTGISTAKAAVKADGYYNLNGQRVAQPTKGLFIVNGKKVMVK